MWQGKGLQAHALASVHAQRPGCDQALVGQRRRAQQDRRVWAVFDIVLAGRPCLPGSSKQLCNSSFSKGTQPWRGSEKLGEERTGNKGQVAR